MVAWVHFSDFFRVERIETNLTFDGLRIHRLGKCLISFRLSFKSGLLIFIDLLQSFSFCSIFKFPLSFLFSFSGSSHLLFQSLFVCMFLSNSFSSFFFKFIDSHNFSCFCFFFFIEKILPNSLLLLKPN